MIAYIDLDEKLPPQRSRQLGELYGRMRPQLRRYLRSWGVFPDEVDDVVSEVFLQVVHRGTALPEDPFPYLVGVARNVVNNRQRVNDRARRAINGVLHEFEFYDRAVDDQADEVVERFAIDQMVAGLPEEVRQTVQLLMDGYEVREVAAILAVHPNAVRRWLDRFRVSVRSATGSLDPAEAANRVILAGIEQNFGASLRAPQPTAAPKSNVERVAHAVSVLSKRQREVVARHLYEQLKPRQIAADLGISPNTARVNLHHAYTALARHLGLPKEVIQEIARSGMSPAEQTAA